MGSEKREAVGARERLLPFKIMLEKNRLAKRASLLRISALTLAENLKNGGFKSVFRGQGIEFSDVRDYFPGDNVRSIDWNVTARMGRPFIKQYEEDRELNVFLIVDCSESMKSGSGGNSRLFQASETAALVLLAAEKNSGAVGAVFFDGEIRFSCPPKSGSKNAMMILSKLDKIESENEDENTNGSALANAIAGASKILKKRSLIFIISDFRAAKWEKSFAKLAEKNDVVAVKITDPSDLELPEAGTMTFFDPETKKRAVFPTSSKKFKQAWLEDNRKRTEKWKDFCEKHGADSVLISTNEDSALALTKFFAQKSMAGKNGAGF